MDTQNIVNPYNGISFNHKWNGPPIQATPQMNLETLCGSKRSQSEKAIYTVGIVRFSLYEMSRALQTVG